MDEQILIDLQGHYSESVHKSLAKVLKNKAYRLKQTNPTVDAEDLEQEAWIRILDVIKKKLAQGKELPISYLVTVGTNCMIYNCQLASKYNKGIDDVAGAVLNDPASPNKESGKAESFRVQYMMSKRQPNQMNQVEIRTSIEQILNLLEDIPIKHLILIRYVKEIEGDSPIILDMYNKFYLSLEPNKQKILDDMDIFSMKDAFNVLGIRHTDNISTTIRQGCRDVFSDIYFNNIQYI